MRGKGKRVSNNNITRAGVKLPMVLILALAINFVNKLDKYNCIECRRAKIRDYLFSSMKGRKEDVLAYLLSQ